MDKKQRLRREPLRRTQPKRHFSKLFDQTGQGGETMGSTDNKSNGAGDYDHSRDDGYQNASSNWSETVAQSVNLGYRVIEEQIRQGQGVAGKLNSQAYEFGKVGGDVQEMFKRMAQSYTELMTLSVGLMDSVSRDFGSTLGRTVGSASQPHRSTTQDDIHVSVRLSSEAPAQVSLNLNTAQGELFVEGLRDRDPEKPAISAVEFSRAPDNSLLISVMIEKGQPAGVYHGAVTDLATDRSVGTLSVQLDD